jgi:UPF0716 protein FxsA
VDRRTSSDPRPTGNFGTRSRRYDLGVLAIFALLFIVIPMVEIYVAVLVGHAIGALDTIGLLVLLSVAGVWLTKHEGIGVISRIRRQLEAHQMPTNELIDGGLVVAGGIMLILPGFVTAAFGLLLLFPPTRVAARGIVKRRFHGRVTYLGGAPTSGRLDGPDDIIDV